MEKRISQLEEDYDNVIKITTINLQCTNTNQIAIKQLGIDIENVKAMIGGLSTRFNEVESKVVNDLDVKEVEKIVADKIKEISKKE